MDDFHGVDEFRPGNFVFYDYMQYLIGSCQLSDIAVCLSAPVIALHEDRGEVVVQLVCAFHYKRERLCKNKKTKKNPDLCSLQFFFFFFFLFTST